MKKYDKIVLSCISLRKQIEGNQEAIAKLSYDLYPDSTRGNHSDNTIKQFASTLKNNGVVSNKQVCMIMANIMAVSDNMIKKGKYSPTDIKSKNEIDFDNTTIYSGKTVYYWKNPPESTSPFYESLSSKNLIILYANN